MTANARLWLEVGIIDIANLTENTSLIELQNRLTRLEGGAVQPVTPSYSAKAPEMSVAEIQNRIKEKFAPETKKSSAPPAYNPPKEETKVEVKTPTEKTTPKPVEEFSPMPKAKPAPNSDIATLWGMVLGNISSVPTRALLKQWANPIKVTPEETVFTMKNEILLQQFTSGNKRQIIEEALDTLFSQTNSKFSVRLPHASDEIIKPSQSPNPVAQPVKEKVAATASVPVREKPEQPTQEEVDPTIEENLMAARADVGELEGDKEIQPPRKSSELSVVHSDQVNMVMDLFDGKIIQ